MSEMFDLTGYIGTHLLREPNIDVAHERLLHLADLLGRRLEKLERESARQADRLDNLESTSEGLEMQMDALNDEMKGRRYE